MSTTQRPTRDRAAATASPPARPGRERGPVLLAGLSVALVVVVVVAAGRGAYPVAPLDVVSSVLQQIGWQVGPLLDATSDVVLWEVRFPRVALGLLVGAALGCAGALMQGVFGNPLAEPGVVGVSSGAAVGAVTVIGLGVTTFGNMTVALAAFGGGLVTTLVVYSASRSAGRTEVVTLVLTGIGVNALAGALIGLLTFYAQDAELRSITFWSLGSVGAATWTVVVGVAPWALVGLLVAPRFARRLDLLALGEGPARHLGVDVERLRTTCICVVAVLTAAAVAVAGVIGFVGLVVPHVIRMIAGPGHRVLIPGSALGGAIVLVGGDLLARTIAAPAEVPLGVLTALTGAPVFFWLLHRTRARQGGWA